MSTKLLVPILLPADPTADLEAATKQYADGKITTHEAASDPHPAYLKPAEVVAGSNVTVDTTTTPGSVIVAATSAIQGPPGPPGQSAGRIFYYSVTDASDISTYKTMLPSPSAAAEQTVNTACSGTSDTLVATFATDPGVPGAVDYPAGTAFRRIYANVNAGTAKFHLQVYVRDLAGTETLVRDEYSDEFSNTTVDLIEWTTSSAAAGTLLSTDRIVNKIYAQRVSGGPGGTVTVTTYWEGTTHTSHIQTTISQSTPPLNTFKEPCRVIATTNQATLTGLLTIDGVTLVASDRVLITGQTTASENGIYYVQSGAWSRAVDADANGEIADGMYVPITEGTTYADSLWRCTATTAAPWVPGSSGSTWSNTGTASIADEGTLITPRRTVVNFVGTGVTVADDSANNRTNVTIPAGISATLIDAKGDLLVGTASDTINRLGVGTDGHVLTADSAEASGVKWAASGGGSEEVVVQTSEPAAHNDIWIDLDDDTGTTGVSLAKAFLLMGA